MLRQPESTQFSRISSFNPANFLYKYYFVFLSSDRVILSHTLMMNTLGHSLVYIFLITAGCRKQIIRQTVGYFSSQLELSATRRNFDCWCTSNEVPQQTDCLVTVARWLVSPTSLCVCVWKSFYERPTNERRMKAIRCTCRHATTAWMDGFRLNKRFPARRSITLRLEA